jgi:hypothetical protein
MGRAYPRLKRTCHLSVVLKQVEREGSKKARQPQDAAAKVEGAKGKAGGRKASRAGSPAPGAGDRGSSPGGGQAQGQAKP